MERQVEAALLSAEGPSVRMRWFVCDNGMTVAEGVAQIGENGRIDWEEERPPAEYEGLVRAAIADARKGLTT